MKILVVEDDEIAGDMLEHTLRRAGYDVIRADNGVKALATVERGEARLVITDWEMPSMSGIDLCRSIRSAEISGYIYIILLTSRDSQSERVEGLSAGADDFVAKPFSPPELLARVQSGERVLSLETRDVAIFALARLAESRDPETGAHLERVQHYSRAIAQQLATDPRYQDEVDAEFIRLVFLTSPLHDIGKVGIPDAVLLKPGPLTEREYAIMKRHAMIGAETLEAALERFPGAKFLQMARDIAASHHEWWDGSGYPQGLAGVDIPLPARIVAVADVFDALTSKRVYKDCMPHELAMSIIAKDAGAHFDPDVVSAFLEIEGELVRIRQRFQDSMAESSGRAVPVVTL